MSHAAADGEAYALRLEAEKLAALAEFAAGAGHEINNPLAVISGRAQLLLARETDPERRRELVTIHRQALRIRELISDLMHFARPALPRCAAVPVPELIAQVVERLQSRAREAKVQIDFAASDNELAVWGDRTQLTVALTAVIENALNALTLARTEASNGDSTRQQGAIHVRADERISAGDVSAVAITVRDNGPGFDAAVRRHLFDPYFSGRAAGRGIGMGLSKCWRIVTLHGGHVEVDSQPGQGATFAMVLPKHPPSQDPASADALPGRSTVV